MPISDYLKKLRGHVGTDLLLMPGVAAVVRDEQGRVLLHQRHDDGSWSLPAGAIDPGETSSAAVAREVYEETGLVVRPERVLGVFRVPHEYPNGDRVEYVVVVFRCAIVGGTLEARDGESIGFRWLTREELAVVPLPYPGALFEPGAELTPIFD
jgi:8-oxo-dGTP pyrophosphatase MutT (NUDIX family)